MITYGFISGVLALVALTYSGPRRIEGILLGFEGGNQAGVYRVLVDDHVELVCKTYITRIDASAMRLRYRVGSRLQLAAVDSGDEPSAQSPLTAQFVKILHPPDQSWRMAGEALDSLVRALYSVQPKECEQVSDLGLGLEPESREALRLACACLRRSGPPDLLGVKTWTMAGATSSGFTAVLNPSEFRGEETLAVELVTSSRRVVVRRLKVIASDAYWELFGFRRGNPI